MTSPSLGVSQHSISHHLLAGAVMAIALVAVIGVWARTTELAGAVIANGVVVVESDIKKVQHAAGGTVAQLKVHDGDQVNAGDVPVRLDDTQTKANLAIITRSLDELGARQARLEAEKEGSDSLRFSPELEAREGTDPMVAHLLDGERKLFSLRLATRTGQKAQLHERAAQLREEMSGLAEQIEAKTQEIALIREELNGVLDLWQKKLVPLTRVTSLKRDAVRLDGERGQLVASKASTGGKISEVELQIIQVDEDARSKVAEELSDVRGKIAELSERKVAAEDLLKHIEVRAPQTGRVHQLSVHTVGGVLGPGETIMLIVPQHDAFRIEAKVSPNDIDQLSPNQPALLRFSAFNQRTTPQLSGTIMWISAELTQDQHTGTSYYTAHIAVSDAELARLRGLKVLPGMPVEAFIQTESRTVLSYLLKPLRDQVMRTFRES
jgi:membrane fusion protein, type I secretion system